MIAFSKQRSGFTVIELLVVVGVIGLLAAITVVAFTSIQRRANESAAAAAVETAAKKLDVYKIANRFYPNALSDADIQDYSNTAYQYYVRGDRLYYCLTATTSKTSMFGDNNSNEPSRGGCPGHGVDGVQPITNYATNPSLESGTLGINGWAFTAATGYTGAISSVKPYVGTKSGVVSVATTTKSESYLVANVSVPSAGTYYVSAYVYITSNATSTAGGGCSGGDKDMAVNTGLTWVYGCYGSSVNTWQRVSVTVAAIASGTIQVRFYPPVANPSTMYVDALMVSDGVSNYADGNTSGWLWLNGVDNSKSVGMAK